MLDISELSCQRGDRMLFGPLSLSLPAGRVLSVEGPNGCGKTTLLRALCGLTTPDHGTICWQGREIAEQRERFASQVTYIGHRNGLKDDLSPMENVQASMQIAGHAVPGETVRAALEAVGLGASCHRLPTKVLSEGQKRRVALARLWCSEQPLWVLDEPFTALDAQSSQLLRDRLQQHVAQGGIVVVATHQAIGIDPQAVQQLRLGE
jgi:heme exporter protein A